jgi:hypothetical protein
MKARGSCERGPLTRCRIDPKVSGASRIGPTAEQHRPMQALTGTQSGRFRAGNDRDASEAGLQGPGPGEGFAGAMPTGSEPSMATRRASFNRIGGAAGAAIENAPRP